MASVRLSKKKDREYPEVTIENKWSKVLENVDYALQPIVNINTGIVLGFEALLRGYQNAGFNSIKELFDSAYDENVMYTLDLHLREKAIFKFMSLEYSNKCKLFYNLDNRVLNMPDYSTGNTLNLLKKYSLKPKSLTFEISEQHKLDYTFETKNIFSAYKNQDYKIAIDDFGSGFSGLLLLYHSEPDYIKIDRFFIEGIYGDPKKKLFVQKVLNLAHILGIIVIAEGVETVDEFFVCKEIGCDFVQGYLIQKPQINIENLSYKYENIVAINKRHKRKTDSDIDLLYSQLADIETVDIDKRSMSDVLEMFQKHSQNTFFPVTDENFEPLGLIREKDLKKYVYSKYGQSLLLNNGVGKKISDFVTKCPASDVYNSIEKITDIFSMDETSEGVILTENGKYAGFLSAHSLLRAINEKNLAIARDQNPLTKLPGNILINSYISDTFYNFSEEYIYVYFDFDNFKPFNDKYGFRVGDRAILLFADIIRAYEQKDVFFAAHIGGDDFFTGIKHERGNFGKTLMNVEKIINKFRTDVEAFYNEEDRNNGYIFAKTREGKCKKYPLLTVSAAVINLSDKRDALSIEELSVIIANTKKKAKTCGNNICITDV
jgi:diguanylate cyclase (GGDEF)-like protein